MSDPEEPPPIRMIDLPRIKAFEGFLLLHGDNEHRVEDETAKVAREIFGISDIDVLTVPTGVDPDEYADQLETLSYDLTDDETMELLLDLGLDFSDDRGNPLRCTKPLALTAEAAALGIKGRLPDRSAAWEQKLAEEAQAFRTNKKRHREAS